MATTYSTNADLKMETGTPVDKFMDPGLTPAEIETQKDNVRLRAYNKINDQYLQNKTVLPATHIPSLKQCEIDFVIWFLMSDSFSSETMNVSEWAEKYKDRAEEVLGALTFDASAETPVADSQNTGNGTISAITTNELFTKTEQWIVELQNATQASVYGSKSGYLPNATVNVQYPEKDWSLGSSGDYNFNRTIEVVRYEQFPIRFLVTGGTIDFVDGDKFLFKTYASSKYHNAVGTVVRA